MNNEFDKAQRAIFRAFCIREYLETKPETEPITTVNILNWFEENWPDTISRQSIQKYLDIICEYDTEKNVRLGFDSGLKRAETKKNKKYSYKKVLTTEQLSMLLELVYSSVFLDESTAIDLGMSIAECDNQTGYDAKLDMSSVLRPFKGENFDAFHNLKLLHSAIQEKCAICYYKGSVNEKKQDGYYKKNKDGKWSWNWEDRKRKKKSEEIPSEKVPVDESGEKILVYPYRIVWDNSRCYLIGLNQFNGKGKWQIRTFRIDRMYGLTMEPNIISKSLTKDNIFYKDKVDFCFDVKKFMGSVFKMWAAEDKYENMRFCVRKDKINIMRDRFGSVNFIPIPDDENHFEFETGIQVTNTFYSWLSGFKPEELRIVNKPRIQEAYLEYLKSILNGYEK